MRRIVAISALLGLALVTLTAAGQKAEEKAADPPDKKPADKAAEKKADPTDAAIAAALAHDPDVRMARAKVQLAEAELAKARQTVTVKVVTLRATVEEQKQAVAAAQETVTLVEKSVKAGVAAVGEYTQARGKLEVARAALARAELELKLMTGGGAAAGVGAAGDVHHFPQWKAAQFLGHHGASCTTCHVIPWDAAGAAKPGDPNAATARGLDWLSKQIAERPASDDIAIQLYMQAVRAAEGFDKSSVRGAIPDRIRAALDKKVKLAPKGEKVPLDQALEVFKKDAGLDVPIRGVGDLVHSPAITSQGEEMTVGAWLQLYQDYSGEARFYVREYGLLFTHKSMAPPDALTLTQFWDLKPPANKEKPKE
jgi:hypothetical protein